MVFVVSDSVGETADFVVKAAVSQFNSGFVDIRRVAFVNNLAHITEIVNEAKDTAAIIAYTIVLEELREALVNEAKKHGVPIVDILGPMVDALAKVSGRSPKMKPGLLRKLDKNYFSKVEAIEFAVKYDDGKDPRGVLRADVVIIGVSRTSKTPLCMYLAHKSIKAANVPLVPEVAPPEEIFNLARNRVVGLTIKPELLNEIRQERLRTLGLKSGADYASLERILNELDYADAVMRKVGCPVVDVSNKAVEETASKILEIIRHNLP
ncbi:MAG: phosphoenolpyruvate synthase regulatory protein [Firmicutes bacterium HGW-Firmicutes-8]|nr:MAG: phosphoenolpyruvate synthase regulatory protein [Firmicutes bacterium HGW-Firmicutes-8]